MTNFMTKLKTGIAIGALMAGTIMGSANAQAIALAATIGDYDFSNPWDNTVLNHTYADQKSTLEADGWIFATLEIVDSVTDTIFIPDPSGFTAGSFVKDYTGFVRKLGFDTSLGAANGLLACKDNFCDIRLNTEDIANAHKKLDDRGLEYSIGSIADSEDLNLFFGLKIGALGYKIHNTTAPSPEVTGLMIGGLGLMGFAALRRK